MSQVPTPELKPSIFRQREAKQRFVCLSAPIAIECARTTPNDFCRSPTADTPIQEASGKHRVRASFLISPRRVLLEASELLQQLGKRRADCRRAKPHPADEMRMVRPSALVDINFIQG